MTRGTVAITLPSHLVGPASQPGVARETWRAALPAGTRVNGLDLTGAALTATDRRESASRTDITHLLVPAGDLILTTAGGSEVTVDAEALRHAVADAVAAGRERAVCLHAIRLIDAGDRHAAREALGALLEDTGLPLPPAQTARATQARPATERERSTLGAYETLGILAAFVPVCPVETHSSDAVVPTRYDYVAFEAGRCVTTARFSELLAIARSGPQRHGGALEEHSIGYVARQLSQPFSRLRGRVIVELNGRGADVTNDILTIPNTPLPLPENDAAPDVLDLGFARLGIDRLALVDRLGMGLPEADAVVDWLMARLATDVEIACDRMGLRAVSALLRSAPAVRALLAAGVTVERPATRDHVSADPSTGGLAWHHRHTDGAVVQDTLDEGGAWCASLEVASDDRWRVRKEDALVMLHANEGSWADALGRARAAYLADEELTWRNRVMAAPSRDAAERTLTIRSGLPDGCQDLCGDNL